MKRLIILLIFVLLIGIVYYHKNAGEPLKDIRNDDISVDTSMEQDNSVDSVLVPESPVLVKAFGDSLYFYLYNSTLEMDLLGFSKGVVFDLYIDGELTKRSDRNYFVLPTGDHIKHLADISIDAVDASGQVLTRGQLPGFIIVGNHSYGGELYEKLLTAKSLLIHKPDASFIENFPGRGITNLQIYGYSGETLSLEQHFPDVCRLSLEDCHELIQLQLCDQHDLHEMFIRNCHHLQPGTDMMILDDFTIEEIIKDDKRHENSHSKEMSDIILQIWRSNDKANFLIRVPDLGINTYHGDVGFVFSVYVKDALVYKGTNNEFSIPIEVLKEGPEDIQIQVHGLNNELLKEDVRYGFWIYESCKEELSENVHTLVVFEPDDEMMQKILTLADLTELSIVGYEGKYLSDLKGIKGLRRLDLINCNQIADLNWISGCSSLEVLTLVELNPIGRSIPSATMDNLTYLNLSQSYLINNQTYFEPYKDLRRMPIIQVIK